MAHGAGRPGQPVMGQRPMFGGGSPVFAQMPTYTPVTRGTEQRQPAPEPPQPAYSPYTASPPAAPSQAPVNYQSSYSPAPSQPSYPAAAPSYQSPHPAAPASYQSAQPAASPSYSNLQSAAPSYQAADFQTQAYRGANQQVRAPSFQSVEPAPTQTYPTSGYNGGAQAFPSQTFRDQSFTDASYPGLNGGDASFPEASFSEQNPSDANFANQGFANQNFADASFPEQGFDSNFQDASYPAESSFGHQEHSSDNGGYAQAQAPADQGFDNFSEEGAQDYVMASQSGQVPPSDPRRQLQAFDALYDQPPQIALGSTDQTRRATQEFYEGERVDADFLDEGQALPAPGARSKMAISIKGRSAFMVGSALLGAIALGGALAFAYKQSGGGIGSGEAPPVVTADARPVKELPDQPGGKEFPHKNKLIYDRLQNGDEPEADHLVPRQEDVAVPALPPSTETAGAPGAPTPVVSTDLATPPAAPTVDGSAPATVASVDDPNAADGGPRRVKTMVVRPDGSVMAPPEAPAGAAAPAEAPADMQLAAAGPAPAQAAAAEPPAAEPAAETPPAPTAKPAPQQVAAAQAAPAKPKPVKPVTQTASITPAPAAAAATKYVVQVGSKKNQTEALASFADMQQKYPALLASYRPMVQKADLGAKGVWYRLRIGPIADKTAATKLCGQLKSQGLPDCLVTAQ
jgi:cell division septation protein DedD